MFDRVVNFESNLTVNIDTCQQTNSEHQSLERRSRAFWCPKLNFRAPRITEQSKHRTIGHNWIVAESGERLYTLKVSHQDVVVDPSQRTRNQKCIQR